VSMTWQWGSAARAPEPLPRAVLNRAWNSSAQPSETIPMPSGGLAIAHRRVEPDDSRDFFPTPLWATRALIEHVFAHLGRKGHCQWQEAWEPACGEGHMAAPLEEYFRKVYASDKYPYGYGDSDTDFLTTHLDGFDWIITIRRSMTARISS